MKDALLLGSKRHASESWSAGSLHLQSSDGQCSPDLARRIRYRSRLSSHDVCVWHSTSSSVYCPVCVTIAADVMTLGAFHFTSNVWNGCLVSGGTTESETTKHRNGSAWLHCPIFRPVDALLLGTYDRLDEDTPANKALKSHVTKSTSVSRPPGRTCVVHGTSIARSAPKWFHPSHGTCVLESGGVPSAVDTVVQRRYTALDNDDDDDGNKLCFMGL